MPDPKLNPKQLREALHAHTAWLIKERDHYANQYTTGRLDISRETANSLHHVLWMLASRTLDEFGDRDAPGFSIPLPPIPEPTRTDELQATVFPPAATRHGTNCPPGCCGAGVRQWRLTHR